MRAASLLVLVGCASHGSAVAGDARTADAAPTSESDGGGIDFEALVAARPYMLHVPANLPPGPRPLVVFVHGYGWDGGPQEADVIHWPADADQHGYLLAMPDGTPDGVGMKFWNATDACCSMFATNPPDDVMYLEAVILHVKAHHDVDPKRVYMTGHSNGAFMTHRFACDRGGELAAIAPLAGMTWKDPAKCPAAAHVPVVDTHADTDELINYNGGTVPFGTAPYPSTMQTVMTWANDNGCTGALAPGGSALDVDTHVVGAETTRRAFGGCPDDGAVEFWTITGGQHDPTYFGPVWAAAVWEFFAAHAR
jgi:polyhydroxybutyrate depolymerase